MSGNDTTTHKRCEPPGRDIREFPCGCVVEVFHGRAWFSNGAEYLQRCSPNALRQGEPGSHAGPPLEDDLVVIAEDLRRSGFHDAAVYQSDDSIPYLDQVVTLRITPDVVLHFDFNLDGRLRYRGLDPR